MPQDKRKISLIFNRLQSIWQRTETEESNTKRLNSNVLEKSGKSFHTQHHRRKVKGKRIEDRGERTKDGGGV